jgi:RimJ/RimL family protein N-acetyltransferase
MKLTAFKTELPEIESFRSLFLRENNFQIRYNACHERNWSDSYLLSADDIKIGYGSIKGKNNRGDRDSVFEFFVIPSFRKIASLIFAELVSASGAIFIECQSNDPFLLHMLYEFTQSIKAGVILFEDFRATEWILPGVIFRRRREDDVIFDHQIEPVGEYVLEIKEEVVATGGFMLHYNKPFSDLYMEVKTDERGKGLGSFILQELKKESYQSGRVPAARCDIQNKASKATLAKAGLKIAGFLLTGDIIQPGY